METTVATINVTLNGSSTIQPAPDNNPALELSIQVVNVCILAFLMLSMGATTDIADFKETFRHPAGFFVGMLCQFLIMPLIGFCLSLAFSLESAGALSVLILACCPGGTLSNLFCYLTDADVCLSICMTTVSTTVAIGMMPLNLFIYSRVWSDEKSIIPYVNIVTTLITILIPVVFGVFLRWWKKEWTTYITRISLVVAVIFVILNFVLTTLLNPKFIFAGWQLWFCAASLPLFGFALGYAIAFLLRQSHRKCRTIAFETGSQNVALATTLTVITFTDSPLFLDMLFYPMLYACFIKIDSLIVIGVYKLVVRYMIDTRDENDEHTRRTSAAGEGGSPRNKEYSEKSHLTKSTDFSDKAASELSEH